MAFSIKSAHFRAINLWVIIEALGNENALLVRYFFALLNPEKFFALRFVIVLHLHAVEHPVVVIGYHARPIGVFKSALFLILPL